MQFENRVVAAKRCRYYPLWECRMNLFRSTRRRLHRREAGENQEAELLGLFRNRPGKRLERILRWLLLIGLSGTLAACGGAPARSVASQTQSPARALFEERCKTAGEKIHRRAEGVEGIFLMKLRPDGINFSDQFKMDDPYGRDLGGDGYIRSFLKGVHEIYRDGPDGRKAEEARRTAHLYPKGYAYVEAVDSADGKLYRFTGSVKDVIHTRSITMGGDGVTKFTVKEFTLDRTPIDARSTRYGVTYDDISTRQDREHWIAGSSLRVIDLQTSEVIAERIGYMMDWAQGSRAGGRSPWLFAADTACPRFTTNSRVQQPESTAQPHQTARFIDKVLVSKGGEQP